jgi:hypothetical protein
VAVVYIYAQIVHRIQRTEHTTIKRKKTNTRKKNNNYKEKIGKCGPCPIFASYTLAFALQLRKKHGQTSGYGKISEHGNPLNRDTRWR